jgi:1-deoxy-D-xylulose-5-phosphate synthase
MPDGTGLSGFARRYPSRFVDVGIAEQHAVTMASGMARAGYRPVVAVYSTFLQRAYDQVVHDVCLPNLPVLFAIDRAGLVGEDGETHHGVFDLSMLRHIPNMTVLMPKDYSEMEQMLDFSLELPGPVAIRYPRGAFGALPVTLASPLALGKGEVLRDGRDVTIIALGPMLHEALKAQAELHSVGISAAVINPRFVKPLDHELLQVYAARTGSIITVEEHTLQGGLGSAVLETLTRYNIRTEVRCLGIGDQFVPHGNRSKLLSLCRLTVQDIVAAAKSIFEDKERKWRTR